MNKPRVYIAGPYKSDPVGNTRRAIEIADDLAHLGVTPFVPHLSLLWDFHRPNPETFYLDLDMGWLRACDALYRIPGVSDGADQEMFAMWRLGRPVFLRVDALVMWADEWRRLRRTA